MKTRTLIYYVIVTSFQASECAIRHCYSCRSRGELGDCRDPFPFNSTMIDEKSGVKSVPCSSGWCSKVIEGYPALSSHDPFTATERQCMQRGPSDLKERCTEAKKGHRMVFVCFCNGDLCNSAVSSLSSLALLAIPLMTLIVTQMTLG